MLGVKKDSVELYVFKAIVSFSAFDNSRDFFD